MTRLRLEVPASRDGRMEVAPDLDALRRMVGRYGQVPLAHTYIADCETPVSAFLKLRDGGPAFLLESVEHGRLGRHSMIGVRPQGIIRGAGGELTVTDERGASRALDASDPFGAVEDVVRGVGMAPPPEPLAFWGGAVGFFGYDLVRTVEHLPDQPPDDLGIPDLIALITGPVVVFDHLRRSLTLVAPCPLDPEGDLEDAYESTVGVLAELKGRLSGPLPQRAERAERPALGPVTSNVSRERFEASVERTREYIFAGDAFQVVPSQRFSAPMELDPFAVYRGLRTVNPSPYMYFLETDEVTLVGSSPEMLVKVEDGLVEMHPIAGSRPRGSTEEEDDRFCEELLADPKERAEHVMLVDLGRNDVGRVSEIGSVHVTELMDVHRYSHVMHIGAPSSAAWPRAGVPQTPCGRSSRPARSRARRRCGRWRSSTSSRPPSAGPTAARWAGSAGTATSTPASPSARSSAATASRTCRRERASWPTRIRRPSTRRPRTRRPRSFARSRSPPPRATGSQMPPRVVLIDNYDTFTYNLVQYLGELGAEVLVHRNDAIDVAGIAGLAPSHLVVSPGPKSPDQAGVSVDAVRALAGTMPILGVCLGHQAIGQAFGGRIVRGREPVHGKTSRIHHDGRAVFSGLDNPMLATRYHSLVIDPQLAPDLVRTAWCDDDVVMGVRHRELPVEGVQFHPESILTGSGKALLANFLALARH